MLATPIEAGLMLLFVGIGMGFLIHGFSLVSINRITHIHNYAKTKR